MRPLRDLELLIESRYPIVAVQAFDEDRVEATLRRLTGRMSLPLFTWTVSQGLRRYDAEAAIYDTHEATSALAAAVSLEEPGVFFFKDLERVFDQPAVLGWLQGRPPGVFVIATCNSATTLPPELMRKGRFDEIFFVDLPADHERAAIFAAQLRARQRAADDFDLTALAGASDGFSGAEIEAVVVAALYAAFAAGTTLTTAHLAAEIGSTVPLAVTRAEAVAELRAWARDRAVPAGRAQAA